MINIVGILIFVLILGIVVFVHEFGHYIMARRCGIFVEEFAMGMGPKILTFRGKKKALSSIEGQEDVTLYTLRAFPIGGFCKMRGMEENIPGDLESMNNKSVFDRILVIIGGSFMNFLLAIILFAILAFLSGYRVPIVTSLVDGMPAQQAGIQVGDRITHINGSRVNLWDNFRFVLDNSNGNPIDVRINRDGQRMNVTLTPIIDENGHIMMGITNHFRFGALTYIPEGFTDFERATILGSIGNAADTIVFHIRTPFRIIARLVTRQPVPDGAGVVGIIGLGGQVAEIYSVAITQGILDTVLIMIYVNALISVAIGTMNLLPIPALDGARLVFLVIEGIRKKPISQEREGMVHLVGFGFLILIFIFVTYRDIINLM